LLSELQNMDNVYPKWNITGGKNKEREREREREERERERERNGE